MENGKVVTVSIGTCLRLLARCRTPLGGTEVVASIHLPSSILYLKATTRRKKSLLGFCNRSINSLDQGNSSRLVTKPFTGQESPSLPLTAPGEQHCSHCPCPSVWLSLLSQVLKSRVQMSFGCPHHGAMAGSLHGTTRLVAQALVGFAAPAPGCDRS